MTFDEASEAGIYKLYLTTQSSEIEDESFLFMTITALQQCEENNSIIVDAHSYESHYTINAGDDPFAIEMPGATSTLGDDTCGSVTGIFIILDS